MSILAEVLESSNKVDLDYIVKTLPSLQVRVNSLKDDLSKYVGDVYIKYCKRKNINDTLFQKSVEYQQALDGLKKRADFILNKELVTANQELLNNIQQIHELTLQQHIISNVTQILTSLYSFDENLDKYEYISCVEIINKTKKSLQEISGNETSNTINTLKEITLHKELTLESRLKNIFTSNIELLRNTPIVYLKIKKRNDEMQTAVSALHLNSEQVIPLQNLARDLWNYIFIPIVNSEVILEDKEDNQFSTLSLEVIDKIRKSDYTSVFKHLKAVLNFLSSNFNYNLTKNLSALEYIGNDLRDNLSEMIIKNCLRETIPSNTEELANYDEVKNATKELEEALYDAKIFNEGTVSILEYANNVDVLFINKKCEEYLEIANQIMKKDLHDVMEIGVPYNSENPLDQKYLENPQCYISKNVEELITFCENLLIQALDSKAQASGRIFVTVTKILTTYRTFVPEYHKNYLTNIPQQIAIFLNNCQYISRQLIGLNAKYCLKLKHVLDSCDFTSEASRFPAVGLEIFEKYVQNQIKQVDDIMGNSQLEGPTIEKLEPKAEKCIRQCLRQQELLRTVWHKILPQDIYNKYIGLIVNTLCKNLITRILSVEDIKAQVAEELADIIKLILTRAPKLFLESRDIAFHVPLWHKLNELVFVLNASLAEINDRWADHKGPLALHFEGAELKKLIKALFQNTDRRAKVLARISASSSSRN
ncbi:hypothetical protein ABEB36_013900 [Hypothenemus hampei]|uniref:Centromere/kinetochore protein zw10 n=1 Tax=Hypothenemus hampei TaxID=57062 RepID=A0ABD1E5M5_HYPHA